MHCRLLTVCLAAASLVASPLVARAALVPGARDPAAGADGQGACEVNPSMPGCPEVIAAVDACESNPNLPCGTADCKADPSQPACQGVDCSAPANAAAPACAAGPDCALPESVGLPECTGCADPASAGRPECTDCSLKENADKPECAGTTAGDPCATQDPPPDWCKSGEDPCAADSPPEWCSTVDGGTGGGGGSEPCDPSTQDCTVPPPFYWRDCTDETQPCYMYMTGGPLPVMAGGTRPQTGTPPRPNPRPSPPAGKGPSKAGDTTCQCILLYAPVCGKDGKTYSNACFAGCAKAGSVGACRQRSPAACWLDCQAAKAGCKCGFKWAPTCGVDGNVYSNACFAKCKTSVQFSCGRMPWGACKRRCLEATCVCPMIYAPVCGKDGRVYGSACQAQCMKQPVRWPCQSRKNCAKDCKAAAKPPPDCFCPEIYAPVCTTSGKVVANECFAKCNKLPVRWPCGSRRDCAKACKAAAKPGVGAPTCACTKELRPVCVRSGALFKNHCLARCGKAAVRFPCGVMSRSSCLTACKKAAAGNWR